jgi:hypothetical protein
MTRTLFATLAALAVVLCACGEVISLAPLVVPGKSLADAGLVGSWREVPKPDVKVDPKHEVFTVTPVMEGGYEFGGALGDAFAGVRVLLAEIAGSRYLDLCFEPDGVKSDTYVAMAIPTHRIYRYARDGDRFTLRGMEFDRFRELVEAENTGVSFARREDGVVVDAFTPEQKGQPSPFKQIILTDTPERLRAWLEKHGGDEKLWADAQVYERVTPKE